MPVSSQGGVSRPTSGVASASGMPLVILQPLPSPVPR